VKEAELPFKAIFTGKLRRYFSWQNFIDPFLVLLGFFQALWIMVRFWPQVVFAKGGFVSVPVAFAAFVLRRPIILHESDSRMGLSNRIVSRLARQIVTAFPDVISDENKVRMLGNPVRESIQNGDSNKGYNLTGFRPEKPVLLVWGGSQGAQQINDMIEADFKRLKSTFQVVHITGKNKITTLNDPNYCQFEYLDDDLKHIYAITDLAVTRAGANSLYELAAMQIPSIMIPLKNAANNHQQYNAEYFESKGAGLILRDRPLPELLSALWSNPEERGLLKRRLSEVAMPESARLIAEMILSYCG
jgi:UDP-N-acetylglucosamine--N-acetylmuramyl-(pentapeptide) pyrophosphoryl-undecaprenol N-acetylglucosamine transferase